MEIREHRNYCIWIPHIHSHKLEHEGYFCIEPRRYDYSGYNGYDIPETKNSKESSTYYKSEDDNKKLLVRAGLDAEFDKLSIFGDKMLKQIPKDAHSRRLEIRMGLEKPVGSKKHNFYITITGLDYEKGCEDSSITYDCTYPVSIDKNKRPDEYFRHIFKSYDDITNSLRKHKYNYKHSISGGICFKDSYDNEMSVVKDNADQYRTVTEFSIKHKGKKDKIPFKGLIPVLENKDYIYDDIFSPNSADFILYMWYEVFENGKSVEKRYTPILAFNLKSKTRS